jgi:hypothetical protein
MVVKRIYVYAAMPKKTNERLGLSINATVRRRFTAICSLKGLSMSEVIEELMIEWTKQNSDVLTELIEEEPPSPSKGKGGQEKKTPKQ